MMKLIWMKKINAERGLWCFVVAAFCWTDIADYHHMVNNKKLCVWIVLGLYYAFRQGAAKRENRVLSILCMLFGGAFSVFLIKTNFFANYIYYNYTIGALSIVLLLQYGLIIKKSIIKHRLPNLSATGILLLLMMLYTQLSPFDEKIQYLGMFFILLPYASMELEEQRQKQIFTGIVDGLCVGFVLCQGYTFLYRPYVLTGNGCRFKSYRDYCTNAGVSYLQFFIGCLFRYAIWFQEGSKKWIRKLFFGLAAFSFSFIYITGGRMPLFGALVVTAIVFAWIYKEPVRKYRVALWTCKCVWLVALSLLLFPTVYAGTRYLPTIINKPDLQDSEGNRINSFATVHLKQKFLYNEEWSYWSVMEGDPRDSVKYITFVECVGDTLCRAVPGLDNLLYPIIADDIFEDKVARLAYLHETGEITDLGFCEVILIYCDTYGQKVPEKYRKLVEENIPLLELLDNTGITKEDEEIANLQKMPSLLLKVYASEDKEIAGTTTKQEPAGRGDSPETAWFESEGSYSALQLRNAIHLYTLGKLNLFGHERKSFEMYYVKGEDYFIGNAHNIFLNFGYEYGIPAMVFLAAVFVLLTKKSWQMSRRKSMMALLLPAVLVCGFSAYGWFETGFNGNNCYSILILLSTVLWRDDII